MILQALTHSTRDAAQLTVKLNCPLCRHAGTFDSVGIQDLCIHKPSQPPVRDRYVLGHRACPDPKCRAHVFFVWQLDGEGAGVVATYPPVLVAFDTANLPKNVVHAMCEAIQCHAVACHRGAAMLVRKALEALCEAQGATGANLKERVADLGSKIVLPRDLLAGLDTLRVLGNDAAHVEARVYDDIGSEEVETALEFAKEVLKACYQYSALVAKMKPKPAV